mmetsp:Transcript_52386/g.164547  ORF Transcript_52386/g.164547 Transcript_52386/m.164547 type:complete len:309 (+) Transcript_52386:89-1015(+)
MAAVALHQPRAPPRRLAQGALCAAAVALAALLPSFNARVFEPPPPAVQHVTFTVALPASKRASRVARAAGKEGTPGAKPVFDGDVPPPADEAKPERVRPGHESLGMQQDRVTKRTKFLKGLKGKYVPWGPKPWDKHRFLKVSIQTRLKAKQASNTKIINQVVEELRRISGMHPWVVKARHDVNAFGWRKGANCGVAVSLKGPLMYDFLHRLNTIILPRVRDFEGLYPNSFDNFGNFWMGFDSQEPFRELDELIDSRELVHGFDVGIINNCLTQPDGLALMKQFGFPFGEPRPMKAIKRKKSYVKMRPN